VFEIIFSKNAFRTFVFGAIFLLERKQQKSGF
jgi:hypothetical protein